MSHGCGQPSWMEFFGWTGITRAALWIPRSMPSSGHSAGTTVFPSCYPGSPNDNGKSRKKHRIYFEQLIREIREAEKKRDHDGSSYSEDK